MIDGVRFKSGREIYANRGLIGISPEIEICGGYDQMILIANDHYEGDAHPDDMRELADLMIERWTRFKEQF